MPYLHARALKDKSKIKGMNFIALDLTNWHLQTNTLGFSHNYCNTGVKVNFSSYIKSDAFKCPKTFRTTVCKAQYTKPLI